MMIEVANATCDYGAGANPSQQLLCFDSDLEHLKEPSAREKGGIVSTLIHMQLLSHSLTLPCLTYGFSSDVHVVTCKLS